MERIKNRKELIKLLNEGSIKKALYKIYNNNRVRVPWIHENIYIMSNLPHKIIYIPNL